MPPKGLLGSAALWATIAGQSLFGFLGDGLGRKRLYGVEAAILTLGAVLNAAFPNLVARGGADLPGLQNRRGLPHLRDY